ncbi:FadR/GntR family transcriptional regulator [Hyalangium gracile]|uniref:FadR/GntR family transcriptional regulator n=1 Tax=Hyalangium gracile TaxID=394092 RepID=UPI001CCEE844|nr:GntR family transcriptional regulator [Hyalangium gracile]
MEHKGLVSRVAEQLEQTIALGQWPKGRLPSERQMAQRYGVSRTTIRGALQGLAARGLIVQHPGRQSRTVPLGEALSLENLKLLLPEGRKDMDRRPLLEGFFALKREVTVELLAACCEHASQQDVELLLNASFALRDEARWQEKRTRWVEREFDLLRLAAQAADRPGHLLLLMSLEKAFRGLADALLPALQPEALQQWAQCVFNSLADRDAQALRQQLPALLKAADEPLLDRLAPVRDAHTAPVPLPPSGEVPVSGENASNWSACHTSSQPIEPTGRGPLHAEKGADVCATSSRNAPSAPPAPLPVGEWQEDSCGSESIAAPPAFRSTTGGVPASFCSAPTLMLAWAPPSFSAVSAVDAGGPPAPSPEASTAVVRQPVPNERQATLPADAGNPASLGPGEAAGVSARQYTSGHVGLEETAPSGPQHHRPACWLRSSLAPGFASCSLTQLP